MKNNKITLALHEGKIKIFHKGNIYSCDSEENLETENAGGSLPNQFNDKMVTRVKSEYISLIKNQHSGYSTPIIVKLAPHAITFTALLTIMLLATVILVDKSVEASPPQQSCSGINQTYMPTQEYQKNTEALKHLIDLTEVAAKSEDRVMQSQHQRPFGYDTPHAYPFGYEKQKQ